MDEFKLWCYIAGEEDYFDVYIPSAESISRLKERIYDRHVQFFAQYSLDAPRLTLTKVDVDLEYVEEDISNRRYRSNAKDRKLRPRETISDVWPGEPPSNHLHVFVSLPSATAQSASPSARNKKHNVPHDRVPKHKKEFEDFHTSNGVRTITGSIGPVKNVRMLLKTGYRYVYVSRKFAMRHGFIPQDAAPGHYGYSGLVNIGKLPITVGKTKTTHAVYLSEESHFDVVLGRSFMEKRLVKTNPIDPTDIICLDTGEKLDCELVILKDGKGEIVTVT